MGEVLFNSMQSLSQNKGLSKSISQIISSIIWISFQQCHALWTSDGHHYYAKADLDRAGLQRWRHSQGQSPGIQKCTRKSPSIWRFCSKTPASGEMPGEGTMLVLLPSASPWLVTPTAQEPITVSLVKHQSRHLHLVTNTLTSPTPPCSRALSFLCSDSALHSLAAATANRGAFLHTEAEHTSEPGATCRGCSPSTGRPTCRVEQVYKYTS